MGRAEYQNELGNVLREYARVCGCFTKEQAYMMLPEKHYSAIDKILFSMLKSRTLFLKDERYYTINPKATIDFDMIKCLWIMLDLKGNDIPGKDDYCITRSKKPAKLAFIRKNVMYEIVAVNSKSASDILFLDRQYEEEVNPESTDTGIVLKYILVLNDINVVDMLPEMQAPHTYAYVHDIPYAEMDYEMKKLCKIDYYEMGE